MTFHSILNLQSDEIAESGAAEAPAYFADLNLDQIVAAITSGKGDYRLKPFFYAPLETIDAIEYRHQVMRDLEDRSLFDCISAFASKMKSTRERLAQSEKMHTRYQKEIWFLDAIDSYCEAVRTLYSDVAGARPRSEGSYN